MIQPEPARLLARLGAALLALLLLAPFPAHADPAMDTALAVLSKSPIIDGHNDTPEQIRNLFGNDFSKFDFAKLPPEQLAKAHTDIASLRAGKVGGQFWSVWVDDTLPEPQAVVRVLEQIDVVEQLAARYPETFALARTASEVEAAMKRGRIASLIGMEGGHSIAGSLGVLRQMYRAGARYMTITHFHTTAIADSGTDDPRHDGLSPLGVSVVREMNRLGMLVDISHVSEATMNDVLDIAQAPVIFSHSGARAVLDHPRNIPDAVLKRLPANGGVAMVTFVPGYISADVRRWAADKAAIEARFKSANPGNSKAAEAALKAWEAANPEPKSHLNQVADMIDHVRKVAGIDHIGIGGDFGGIDTVPAGLENVSTYPALFAELVRRGYSRADLAKIAQGNILRVMRAAERAARPER